MQQSSVPLSATTAEIEREASLLKAGAVTQEEYQREKAQAQNADAKVRQAQARITQTEAQIRAAQSGVQKADAMIASAKSKLETRCSKGWTFYQCSFGMGGNAERVNDTGSAC